MEHMKKEFGRFGRVYAVKLLHPEVIKAKCPIKEVQLACYHGKVKSDLKNSSTHFVSKQNMCFLLILGNYSFSFLLAEIGKDLGICIDFVFTFKELNAFLFNGE